MEQWRSVKDLHAQVQSGLYMRVLHAIELACEEPRISFHEVSQFGSVVLDFFGITLAVVQICGGLVVRYGLEPAKRGGTGLLFTATIWIIEGCA